jgi:hypothetical protein
MGIRAKCLLVAALLLLAGCGSSSTKTASTKATTPTVVASPPSSPLAAWVVAGSEETGYQGAGTTVSATVQQFVATDSARQQAADAAALRRNGFRTAVVEQMSPTRLVANDGGVSVVIEFASPAAAKREQVIQLHSAIASQGPGPPLKSFTVPGVPGADGFTASGGHGTGAANVVFREGSCVLLIGDADAPGSLSAPLIHAAAAVYRRTHGSCP